MEELGALRVDVDRKLLLAFRWEVMKKHGTNYRKMRQEVEAALHCWLQNHEFHGREEKEQERR